MSIPTIDLKDLRDFAAKKASADPEERVDIMDGGMWLTSQWAGSVLGDAAGHVIQTFSNFWSVDVGGQNVFKIPKVFREWNRAQDYAWFLWGDLVDILDDLIEEEKIISE